MTLDLGRNVEICLDKDIVGYQVKHYYLAHTGVLPLLGKNIQGEDINSQQIGQPHQKTIRKKLSTANRLGQPTQKKIRKKLSTVKRLGQPYQKIIRKRISTPNRLDQPHLVLNIIKPHPDLLTLTHPGLQPHPHQDHLLLLLLVLVELVVLVELSHQRNVQNA